MSAAAALNTRIRLEGEQMCWRRTGSRSAALPEAVDRILGIPGAGLADEETPLVSDASPPLPPMFAS